MQILELEGFSELLTVYKFCFKAELAAIRIHI